MTDSIRRNGGRDMDSQPRECSYGHTIQAGQDRCEQCRDALIRVDKRDAEARRKINMCGLVAVA